MFFALGIQIIKGDKGEKGDQVTTTINITNHLTTNIIMLGVQHQYSIIITKVLFIKNILIYLFLRCETQII